MDEIFSKSLETALAACPRVLLEPLKGSTILLTGASGFFGHWVLGAISKLNDRAFGVKVQCLSRDPEKAADQTRRMVGSNKVEWIQADALAFADAQIDPDTSYILHMAASSDARQYRMDADAACRTIVEGTRGCMELARRTGAHLHFVSSGAVYGPRLSSEGAAREDQAVPGRHLSDGILQTYADAKRMAESLLALKTRNYSISRPFAFLGPMLPLDQHFAAGNFILDAVSGRAIKINGNGRPLRSYMHPADLAFWLLALAVTSKPASVINIGSDQPISIRELAELVSAIASSPPPVIMNPHDEPDPPAYWPAVTRATELGLTLSLSLAAAIRDGLEWAENLKK